MLRLSAIVGGFRMIRMALTFVGSKPDTHLAATGTDVWLNTRTTPWAGG